MTTFHILNGDCLARQLQQSGIPGELIICRECLIDGNLSGNTLPDFWNTRAHYIATTYHDTEENYFHKVATEFEKITAIPHHATIHLWFEDDLFCQTNLWFILFLLAQQNTTRKVFRVSPTVKHPSDHWKGFAPSNTEMLKQSLSQKTLFTPKDLTLGNALWQAYQQNDLTNLLTLSHTPSNCFTYLPEVCQAHADRFPTNHSPGRPDSAIKQLLESYPQDFKTIFTKFTATQGIYGFGDLQVKAIYDRLLPKT